MRSDYQNRQSIILDMSKLEEEKEPEHKICRPEMMAKPGKP